MKLSTKDDGLFELQKIKEMAIASRNVEVLAEIDNLRSLIEGDVTGEARRLMCTRLIALEQGGNFNKGILKALKKLEYEYTRVKNELKDNRHLWSCIAEIAHACNIKDD